MGYGLKSLTFFDADTQMEIEIDKIDDQWVVSTNGDFYTDLDEDCIRELHRLLRVAQKCEVVNENEI